MDAAAGQVTEQQFAISVLAHVGHRQIAVEEGLRQPVSPFALVGPCGPQPTRTIVGEDIGSAPRSRPSGSGVCGTSDSGNTAPTRPGEERS